MKKITISGEKSLPEVVSGYLRDLIKKTGGVDGPIGKQFIMQKSQFLNQGTDDDPLDEEENKVAPGLIYKYRGVIDKNGTILTYGRVLWMVTRVCASYCRFCTRGREILPISKNNSSNSCQKSLLSDSDIKKAVLYLSNHKEINEVIISGGDPLTAPNDYLTKIINELTSLQKKGQIQIIRIGTRLPIVNPYAIQQWHYDLIKTIINPYIMVHINHPAELTEESSVVFEQFRKQCNATIMSQTVLLKDINDNPQTLIDLFNLMVSKAIRPYYVYQCDPVPWAKRFIVPAKKVIKLWKQLRPLLSGLAATARLVIDVPHGYGKVPLPEGGAWKVDYKIFRDFKKKKFIFE